MANLSQTSSISVNPELQQKEGELATAIVNAIRQAQNHCKPVLDTELGKSLVSICKTVLQDAVRLRNFINTIRRPYIVYAKDLEIFCKRILEMITRVRLLVSQAFPQITQTELQQSLDYCYNLFDIAQTSIMDFMTWIYTNMNSYLLQQNDSPLTEANVPEDKDAARTDMMRCPRWILRHLYEARLNQTQTTQSVPNEELLPLRKQIEEQLKYIADLEEKSLSGRNTSTLLLKRKDEIIQQKEKEVAQKEAAISALNSRMSEFEIDLQNQKLQHEGEISTLRLQYDQELQQKDQQLTQERDHLQNQQQLLLSQNNQEQNVLNDKLNFLKQELSKRLNQEKELNQKIENERQKARERLNKVMDNNQQIKRREKEMQNVLKNQQVKIAELEKKLRIQQAQLRMSRINVDDIDIGEKRHDDVHIIAELSEPLKGDEIVEAEKILEQMLEDHGRDNENIRNAVIYEQQMLDEDFTATKEVEFSVSSNWMNEVDKRQCLAQILLDNSRDYEIIQILGKLFPIGNEADVCVRSILELYRDQNRAMELIQTMIDWEVKTTKSPIQLFRGEEFPARMIRAYTRMLGINFAQKTVGPYINEIITDQISIELDDNPEMQTRTPTEEDKPLLSLHCQRFVDAILGSFADMPIEFLQIANYLTKQVKKRFPDPDATQAAVAGFIFLRFFCPCIASPESFEFRDVTSREVRRTFLLIGKVLQSLANGVTTFKEEYLQCMIPFLEKNRGPMDQFIRQIREWPPRINGAAPYLVKTEFLIHKKKDSLQKNLESDEFAHTLQSLWKQNVTTLPHIRLKEILNKFERLPSGNSGAAGGVGASAVPTPAGVVVGVGVSVGSGVGGVGGGGGSGGQIIRSVVTRSKSSNSESRKINRSKFPTEKDSPLVQSLILTLTDPNMDFPSVITKTIIPKIKADSYSAQIDEICCSLGNIWAANDSFVDLIEGVLNIELSEELSAYDYLHRSFSKRLFTWYTKNYSSKWLFECWGESVTQMVEQNLYLEISPSEVTGDESGNKPSINAAENLEKLKNFYKYFIDKVLGSLNKCPGHLYEFSSILHEYLGDSENLMFKFLFINFFASALEDPFGYQLTTKKPAKHAVRTLTILSEMIISLAKGQEKLAVAGDGSNKSVPMDQTEREEYISRVQNWAMSEQEMVFENFDIDWNKERQELMNLVDFLIENEESIDQDLRMMDLDSNPNISFKFGISELLDSLDPPQISIDDKKCSQKNASLMDTSTSPVHKQFSSQYAIGGGMLSSSMGISNNSIKEKNKIKLLGGKKNREKPKKKIYKQTNNDNE